MSYITARKRILNDLLVKYKHSDVDIAIKNSIEFSPTWHARTNCNHSRYQAHALFVILRDEKLFEFFTMLRMCKIYAREVFRRSMCEIHTIFVEIFERFVIISNIKCTWHVESCKLVRISEFCVISVFQVRIIESGWHAVFSGYDI